MVALQYLLANFILYANPGLGAPEPAGSPIYDFGKFPKEEWEYKNVDGGGGRRGFFMKLNI